MNMQFDNVYFTNTSIRVYQFQCLWFDPVCLELMLYHTRGKHTNHCTTDAFDMYKIIYS